MTSIQSDTKLAEVDPTRSSTARGNRLSLDVVTIRKAAIDIKISSAAASGFDGVELWAEDLDDDALRPNHIRDVTWAAGLIVEGVCPQPDVYRWHRSWDIELEQTLRARLERYRAMGASYLVLPVMDDGGDLGETAMNLRRAARLAAETGMVIGLEPIGHVRKLASIRTASALVADALGDGPVGLVLDTFHFFRGGNTVADLSALDAHRILAVQLGDAMPIPFEELRGDRHRLFPGEGAFDIVGLCRTLHSMKYAGPFIVELMNESYWSADPMGIAGRSWASAACVLREAGIWSTEGPGR
jgi:4-hydroxyphenylpyruvate dioxygenase